MTESRTQAASPFELTVDFHRCYFRFVTCPLKCSPDAKQHQLIAPQNPMTSRKKWAYIISKHSHLSFNHVLYRVQRSYGLAVMTWRGSHHIRNLGTIVRSRLLEHFPIYMCACGSGGPGGWWEIQLGKPLRGPHRRRGAQNVGSNCRCACGCGLVLAHHPASSPIDLLHFLVEASNDVCC